MNYAKQMKKSLTLGSFSVGAGNFVPDNFYPTSLSASGQCVSGCVIQPDLLMLDALHVRLEPEDAVRASASRRQPSQRVRTALNPYGEGFVSLRHERKKLKAASCDHAAGYKNERNKA